MGVEREYVQVPVSGWLVDWVRSLSRATGHEVVMHEKVRGELPVEARAQIIASMGRQLRDEARAYAAREGLVVLAEAPIDHHWTADYLTAWLRFLAMELAPVPPVEEWPWTS